jgi:hypothetical protein
LKKILLILLLIVSNQALSQVLRIGPKVGITANQAVHDLPSYNEEFKSLPTLAYKGGVVTNLQVSDLFSLHSEILYSQRNKSVKSKIVGDYQKEYNRFLSVPLLCRFSYRAGYNEFYVNAGPQVSYWLGGNGKVMTAEVLENGEEEMHYIIGFSNSEVDNFMEISDPNRLQLGLDVGLGAVLPMGPNFLMLDIRYSWGHTNMAKSNTSYLPISFYNDNIRYTHQVLSLSAAYLLDFDFYKMSTKGKSSGSKKE